MVYSEITKRSAFRHEGNGEIYQLQRLPFMTADYNEAWLQKLLEDCPDLLPFSQFDGQYYPLVCVGREIPVGSGDMRGFIDNLMISPSGAIVIVETKLFRNQESRRTVIAQIIDYAKELQKWDARKLDKAIEDYTYEKDGQAFRVIDLMCAKGLLTYADEASFTDAINTCLKEARFLLAIVGDGIRTGVMQLADFLNENGSTPFNVALVALELYADGDATIIIPNLITRTSVIERNYFSLAPVKVEAKAPQGYVKKPLLSRPEFVRTFASNGGYDPDEVAEFVSDMDMINDAKDYVYISTPYLIPDNEMLTVLDFAAKSGVDVRIITPEIPDKRYVSCITRSYHKDLLAMGVRVYEYKGGFNHAKQCLCDDKSAVVGTINFDYRSFYLHFECATFMYESDCIKDIKADFDDLFENKCREITAEDINSRSPIEKFMAVILRTIAPLL